MIQDKITGAIGTTLSTLLKAKQIEAIKSASARHDMLQSQSKGLKELKAQLSGVYDEYQPSKEMHNLALGRVVLGSIPKAQNWSAKNDMYTNKFKGGLNV